jgi:hypothetical protein
MAGAVAEIILSLWQKANNVQSANIDDSIVAIATTAIANHSTPNIFNASNLNLRRLIHG